VLPPTQTKNGAWITGCHEHCGQVRRYLANLPVVWNLTGMNDGIEIDQSDMRFSELSPLLFSR
jgi:hypothetical protein